jgi:2-polyprenyl-3-methyl-5-hydroxy-6-metoxy-1,4-benzoquinol methylase
MGPLKVLISFGAEDRAGLGRSCAAALLSSPALLSPGSERLSEKLWITLVDPQGAWTGPAPAGFRVLRGIPSLGEHLAGYDLLITHFGLSAFEALHAGVPVILVSPGPYHQRLARAAGFVSAGTGSAGVRRLGRLLSGDPAACSTERRFFRALRAERGKFLGSLREYCRSLALRHGLTGDREDNFAGLIASIRPGFLTRRCPCCGDAGGPAPVRFPRRSFRRCPRCGVIYQARIDEPPVEYAREYFFELYKKQYGRTYIEDFPNLISMAERRLSRILPLLPGTPGKPGEGRRLLDIGCAYGAFLQAAARSGFDVLGLDPAEDAVRYVRDTLGLQARQGFFPLGERSGLAGSFSAITLWYVIEHFRDPAGALEEGRRLLAEGGVLAFSTPSFSGISGKTSPRTFLEKSPQDHWTIWSPRTCRRILRRRGFRVKRIVVTGHHPERFPCWGAFAGTKRVRHTVSCSSSAGSSAWGIPLRHTR